MTIAEMITPHIETREALRLHIEHAYGIHAMLRRSWMGERPGLSSAVGEAYHRCEMLERRGHRKYAINGDFDY